MKLFYKKDFKKVSGELEELKEYYKRSIYEINKSKEENYDLKIEISYLENQNKKYTGKLNVLTKEINKLKKELEESMTNKYLVKKIPEGRTPNLNKTKVSKTVKPNVLKYMRDNNAR